jgi:hypothetical protein
VFQSCSHVPKKKNRTRTGGIVRAAKRGKNKAHGAKPVGQKRAKVKPEGAKEHPSADRLHIQRCELVLR